MSYAYSLILGNQNDRLRTVELPFDTFCALVGTPVIVYEGVTYYATDTDGVTWVQFSPTNPVNLTPDHYKEHIPDPTQLEIFTTLVRLLIGPDATSAALSATVILACKSLGIEHPDYGPTPTPVESPAVEEGPFGGSGTPAFPTAKEYKTWG